MNILSCKKNTLALLSVSFALISMLSQASAQNSAIVSPHSGDLVTSNPKGDIFESSGSSLLSPRTEPIKKVAPKKIEKKASEDLAAEQENGEESEGNMENLKEQVMQRAAEEGGMLEIIQRSQQIKKNLGVSEEGNSPVNVDKKMIEDRLKGVQKVIKGTTAPEESNRF